jgi:RHS repeat-associated protein
VQLDRVTLLPPEQIVDNPQASFTGSWGTATKLAGYYGSNYRTNTRGTGNDKAVWTVTIPSTGSYAVYARWVAAATHASNAPYTVKYSGGVATVVKSQRTSGGQWVLLGTYPFTAGTPGTITLTDKANGKVIADAVKLTAQSGGTTTETLSFLHTDPLNTPRLATDAQKQVVWRWEGKAFGDSAPTGSLTVNLRFAGQYYDAESGLHYNWNRYYDPKVGRYLSPDPKSVGEHAEDMIDSTRTGSPEPADFNPYAYAGNNPLRCTDPTGLDYWIEGAVEGEGGYGLHRSVCVGKPGGPRKCISFGRTERDCLFDCKGRVYYDRSAAGPLISGYYRYTDGATDRRISRHFDSLVGTEARYDITGRNCRAVSENIFNMLTRTYGGTTGGGQ